MLRVKSPVIVTLLCFGTFGCNKKIPECNALIQQLNDTSTVMEKETSALGGSKQSKETLEKVATITKSETEKIAKVELTVPELQGFSKSYQTLLNDTVAATRAIGKAAGEADGVQEAVTKAQGGFVAASTKLNVACVKARKECAAVGDKLTRAPSINGMKPHEDAKKLEEYVASIASVEVKNADVKAAVDDIKKTVGDFAAALKKSGDVQEETEKAMKTMTEINAKEPALIKSINDFCQAG
ncbi:MAG TPA: hypothetical protein VMS65_00485 [Polyangiaceae bacterium]|nr:hypothetical protein [Polyangiaceae bacterium]